MNHNPAILGKKIGMTQIFDKAGRAVPVTAIDVTPTVVVQVKTQQTDGYDAVQLGYDEVAPRNVPDAVIKKAQGAKGRYDALYGRVDQPTRGHFFKAGELAPRHFVREIRLGADAVSELKAGDEIKASDTFVDGDFVDVAGISKGHGFTGVIKRHGFAKFQETHGTHEWRRHGGSIGCRQPQRVIKGRRMPGHDGNEQVTIQNLMVAGQIPEQNVLLIRGAVPGPNGGYLTVRLALKKKKKTD